MSLSAKPCAESLLRSQGPSVVKASSPPGAMQLSNSPRKPAQRSASMCVKSEPTQITSYRSPISTAFGSSAE